MGTEAKQQGGISQLQVNLLLVTSLLCSLFSGITFKGQQKIEVDGVYFNHPFMQSMTMFIGEALCYPVFMWYKKKYSERYEESREKALANGCTDKINKYIFIIPTLCDFVTSTISFFAMSMMPLSVNYMVRGGNIVMTAIFSVIWLKRKLYRQHILGILLAVVGLILIGVFALVINKNDDDNSNLLLGIILTVGSFVTYASQMVFEEKLFSKYYLHPFQAVGYEGFWGIFITWIGINIFSYIPCPSVIDNCPEGMMESAPQFFYQVFSFKAPLLFFLVILGIFIILILNGVGLAVTKYASAIVRSLLGVTSPFLVWMFCLAIGWETFAYGQLIGFLVITTGTLIYNEIIILPFLGFNKNLKRDLAKRKQEEEEQNSKNEDTITAPLVDAQGKQINYQTSQSNISYD